MHRLTAIASIVVLGMAPAFLRVHSAAAASPQPYNPNSLPPTVKIENGFYIFTSVPSLPGGKRQMVQGRRNGAICEIREKGTLAPGSAGVAFEEIGVNPSTCQFIVETGLPLPGAMNQSGGNSSSSHGGGGTTARTIVKQRRRFVRTLSQTTSTEHIFSKYSDPFGVNVTSLKDDVTWTWDGSCVDSGSYSRNAYWYSNDGWAVNNASGMGVGDAWYTSCSYDNVDTHAHFLNGIFCAGQTTYNDYWYQRLYGYANGGIDYSFYITDSGGCTNLLTPYTEIGPGA